MSYFNKYIWKVNLMNSPVIERKCPKCKEKTNFINSEKFRVNANGDNIDVWLIYKCENCNTTWNISILDRAKSREINKRLYKGFINNDNDLAREYAFYHSKNYKTTGAISYNLSKNIIEENEENKEAIVNIVVEYPLDIRLDKFLSENLNISRSCLKEMIEKGDIFSEEVDKINKYKLKDGLELHFKDSRILMNYSKR